MLIGVTNIPKSPSVLVSTPRIKGSVKSEAEAEKGKTFSWKITSLEVKTVLVVKSKTLLKVQKRV